MSLKDPNRFKGWTRDQLHAYIEQLEERYEATPPPAPSALTTDAKTEPFSGWLTRCKWCGHVASTKTWNHRTQPKEASEGEEALRQSIRDALSNLGVPGPGYPAPVAEAVRILTLALCNGICPPCDIGENTECLCPPATPAAPAQDGLREALERELKSLRSIDQLTEYGKGALSLAERLAALKEPKP